MIKINFQEIKEFGYYIVKNCCSGIQENNGNPGNLTRLNGFRVHLIYMIRFPPNGLRKVLLST
jgi:hypothetical protein